ncbi:potassium/proton antiporter [Kribbia dieselivorans]|uniref:potassium/proton antiporter n=1 Tax=Kribbia dieselivorans TaxID=331526 RepID=UPI0008396E7D|nr:potassium/proton antiporter [Kribbia dieselivorans]
MDFSLDDLTTVLLIGAGVLVVCVAAVRLSVRSGLPTLLLYLAIGLGIEGAAPFLRFDSPEVTQVLGYFALILILTEGGLTTSWPGIRRSVPPALALSTVGVLVSVTAMAAFAHYALRIDWTIAFLIGAVLSSTDAAAVFSVLRRVPLPRRISGLLEAESGFNDAPVVLIVTAVSVAAANPQASHPWWLIAVLAIVELVGGAAIGIAIGWLGGRYMRRMASNSSGLFSIGVIALCVLAYGVGSWAHTSGFMATYVAALVLGNSASLPHQAAVRGFATALGWIAQIGLFVLLGLMAHPTGFLAQVGPALALGLALLLIARPLSVLVSLTPFRVPWRDQVFLSWAGLRGAVPIVLATVPMTQGVRGVTWLYDLVFVLVVIFTLVQGPTLPWLARRLGLTEETHTLDIAVDSTPLEELDAELFEIEIGPRSRLHGVEVFELRLPKGANITLVVRDGQSFVPQPGTVLRTGDRLLAVSTAAARDVMERRIREVSDNGRLAGWSRRSAYNRPDA